MLLTKIIERAQERVTAAQVELERVQHIAKVLVGLDVEPTDVYAGGGWPKACIATLNFETSWHDVDKLLAQLSPVPTVYYRAACASHVPEGSPEVRGDVTATAPVHVVVERYSSVTETSLVWWTMTAAGMVKVNVKLTDCQVGVSRVPIRNGRRIVGYDREVTVPSGFNGAIQRFWTEASSESIRLTLHWPRSSPPAWLT